MNKPWRALSAINEWNTLEILNFIKRYTLQTTRSFVTDTFIFQILLHVSTFVAIFSDTHYVEKSASWEANWFSVSREIPPISRNPKVHYRIHKCPPTVPILSQLDPVHTPTSYFLKIHLNIINPSMPGFPKWLRSLRIPHQNIFRDTARKTIWGGLQYFFTFF